MVCTTEMIVLFYLFACLSSILETANVMFMSYHNKFLNAVQVSFPFGFCLACCPTLNFTAWPELFIDVHSY